MKKRTLKPVFAAALAVSMMLTACGSKPAETKAAAETTAAQTTAAASTEQTTVEATKAAVESTGKITKDEITVAYLSDIVSMDPQNQSDVASGLIIRHL